MNVQWILYYDLKLKIFFISWSSGCDEEKERPQGGHPLLMWLHERTTNWLSLFIFATTCHVIGGSYNIMWVVVAINYGHLVKVMTCGLLLTRRILRTRQTLHWNLLFRKRDITSIINSWWWFLLVVCWHVFRRRRVSLVSTSSPHKQPQTVTSFPDPRPPPPNLLWVWEGEEDALAESNSSSFSPRCCCCGGGNATTRLPLGNSHNWYINCAEMVESSFSCSFDFIGLTPAEAHLWITSQPVFEHRPQWLCVPGIY